MEERGHHVRPPYRVNSYIRVVAEEFVAAHRAAAVLIVGGEQVMLDQNCAEIRISPERVGPTTIHVQVCSGDGTALLDQAITVDVPPDPRRPHDQHSMPPGVGNVVVHIQPDGTVRFEDLPML